jgi:UDP-N-acetylmuramoylalanine--D-glutamate ligase
MRLVDLDGRRVLVWGLGREGQAALDLLSGGHRCRPASIRTFDDGPREVPDQARQVVDLGDVDVIVKSPGVSRYRPEIEAFVAAGGLVTGLTAIVLAERGGRRTIGVTGTKGKSTTASLTAHLLAAAGVEVELAGNIGRPAVEVMDTSAWVVLECSSYQCADVTVSPEIGIFTSLYQEHLDWHGTFERYAADKLQLFTTARHSFVNAMQAALVAHTSGLASRHLVGDDDLVVSLDTLTLPGRHNRRNANLAVHAAACALGGAHPGFADALASFAPLEHRLHTLGRWGELVVIDDVLATAPEAVLSALEVFADRPVVLLIGGYDRHLDYRHFGATLATRTHLSVIAMGPAGVRMADEIERAGAPRPVTVATLSDALDAVDASTPGVLLLSPGATSYGEFADYRARAARFVAELTARGMIVD